MKLYKIIGCNLLWFDIQFKTIYILTHSHSQTLCPFKSAPRIMTSSLNQFSEHVQSIRFVLSANRICQNLMGSL